jgi:hypothetical protein
MPSCTRVLLGFGKKINISKVLDLKVKDSTNPLELIHLDEQPEVAKEYNQLLWPGQQHCPF